MNDNTSEMERMTVKTVGVGQYGETEIEAVM